MISDYDRAPVTEADLMARAARVERLDDLASLARSRVDHVETAVASGLRFLLLACERAQGGVLGPLGPDLFAAARAVLAVDRALVRLAQERGRDVMQLKEG